ncbi:MAG TPA: TolC family protein [Acidobacteriaceae bacterium]|nr:TolC family protein [Acidobacteriaceae bacterium]
MTIPARSLMAAFTVVFLSAGMLPAQMANQSSAQNPYYGSVTIVKPTDGVKPLTLDEAIGMGIEHNLALIEARQQEQSVKAQSLESLQTLLPTVTAQADSGAHQVNLAALGFSSSVLTKIAPLFPDLNFSSFPSVVKVNVTDAMVNYSQTLFSLPNIDRYRAAKANVVAAYFSKQSSRGLVVLTVGNAYLQALALGAQVDNAQALLQADQVLLNQAVAEHQAGTAANLDELRARVQFQTQQQAVITAEVNFRKAKIALNREIGLPAEQEIKLTDAAPYADLAAMNIDQAKEIAYRSRQDYQGLQAQVRAAQLQRKAARWERLPTLDFQGNYGVTGVTGGLYHGTFVAAGSLNLPLFQEAKFRGDSGVAAANLTNLMQQLAGLKEQINQQLRDSILDVQTATELVRVAQSNVELARKELEQTTERFQAGVDDNLPVVQAQATLANAETVLINTTSQHNQAKLGLARNLGIVDTQYATYLHGP